MLNVKKMLTHIIEQLGLLKNDSLVFVDNVPLTSSGSIAAGGTTAVISTDVSAHIPTGYKLVWANMRGTGNTNAYCWFVGVGINANIVNYRLHNVSGSAITTNPTASLLCAKISN